MDQYNLLYNLQHGFRSQLSCENVLKLSWKISCRNHQPVAKLTLSCLTSQKHLTSGVLLGSVLGPILLLIYINDLPDRTRSKVRLFADDKAIYLAVSSLQDAQILQQDLDRLHEWELQWDMEFNSSKCVAIHVTRARTPVPREYLLHGKILESVGGSMCLGNLEISGNMSFNNQIQKISTSASRSLGFIKHNIRPKSPAIREMAYKTPERPLVEYSSWV